VTDANTLAAENCPDAIKVGGPALAVTPLDQIGEKLHHVAAFQRGIPAVSQARTLQARFRSLKFFGKVRALVAARVKVRTKAMNFKVPNCVFQGPNSQKTKNVRRRPRQMGDFFAYRGDRDSAAIGVWLDDLQRGCDECH
jgi:hypothetical protein